MTTPDWIQDAVFYQIFPDRFANGDPGNDPPNVRPWGAKPTIWDFQGGDLRGIVQRLDYLVDLGINAIYLNPIFQATSNHRYNTTNYYMIDPKLGTQDDFKLLVDEVHRRGIRIVLDGVFNHCGRGFFAFADVLENELESPYRDWFHIKRFPLQAYTKGDARNYLGWYKLKSLPKFNTDNPEVRRYIFDIAKYWIEQGIDGWRLDVPNEIDDDEFWSEFRQIVKRANPAAYLVGEIWKVRPRWVGPNHFDGLMNYPLRDALLGLLKENKLDPAGFIKALDTLLAAYPRENTYAHYVPLGSHDTPRLATLLDGDRAKMKLFYLVLFSFPGAPAIYYGDEVGLQGKKDPDCRRAFPWDEIEWDQDLYSFIKKLIAFRHERIELRRGEVLTLQPDHPEVVGLARVFEQRSIVTLFNSTEKPVDVKVPLEGIGWSDDTSLQDLLSDTEAIVSESRLALNLAPLQGVMISTRD